MTSLAPLVLLAAALNAEGGHDTDNPLYHELRDKGVPISATAHSPLPAPLMPDGLDGKAQMAIIKKLAGEAYSVDDLLYRSPVAPHVSKFRDVKTSDPNASAYGVDLWFIAYGDLDSLAKKEATSFFQSTRKDVKLHTLTAVEMAKRELKAKLDNGVEQRYVYSTYPLLEKVQVGIMSRNVVTRTADSLLLATSLDATFAKDAEYPNQWRAMIRDGDDEVKLGPPQGYDGTGLYMKVTKLAEPAGALFVEYHRVSTEPKKWFDGTGLLRSKLPILIQSEVRSFRRELDKKVSKD